MDNLLFFLIFTALVATIFAVEQAWRKKRTEKRTEAPAKEPASAPDEKGSHAPQPEQAAAPATVLYWYEPTEFKRPCRHCACENPAGAVWCEVCGEKLC